ncbi:MAG: ThuA domain-containing protein [Planctomycetes bacterium]|nr:ThuA domain-containing protein [Planctomycetota bacterium]
MFAGRTSTIHHSKGLTVKIRLTLCVLVIGFGFGLIASAAKAADPWIVFEGGDGPGKGKHIVLISGDDEYRSEEALPQLAKILSKHHGFKCTVLFPIDPADGSIKPDHQTNIPGTEALKSADLAILGLRFRNLPDEQMQPFVDYIEAGKPVIGLRTSTHAFNIPKGRKFEKYGWTYGGKEYEQGFGRQVLGETWISHHGHHAVEGTRGILMKDRASHPILRGLKDGDIFGTTDVYGVRLPLPGDSQPLVLGQVTETLKDDSKPVEGKKNDPMMPVAWTKSYKSESGKVARVFTTTMGASEDLLWEGTRRLIVNASYWCLSMEGKIPEKSKVDLVGDFKPMRFKFGGFAKGVKPEDLLK